MTQLPKIIHQIWSGVDEPLPFFFSELGKTWKKDYPDWQYEYWNNKRMNRFVCKFYPQHWDSYCRFPYNIQRWDAIRYLILDRIGGMYVDFDSECLEPFDILLKGKTCCFSLEPPEHGKIFNKEVLCEKLIFVVLIHKKKPRRNPDAHETLL